MTGERATRLTSLFRCLSLDTLFYTEDPRCSPYDLYGTGASGGRLTTDLYGTVYRRGFHRGYTYVRPSASVLLRGDANGCKGAYTSSSCFAASPNESDNPASHSYSDTLCLPRSGDTYFGNYRFLGQHGDFQEVYLDDTIIWPTRPTSKATHFMGDLAAAMV